MATSVSFFLFESLLAFHSNNHTFILKKISLIFKLRENPLERILIKAQL